MGLFNFRSKQADEAATERVETPAGKQPGFLARLRAKLNRGDSWLTYDLANLLPGGKIDEAVLDEPRDPPDRCRRRHRDHGKDPRRPARQGRSQGTRRPRRTARLAAPVAARHPRPGQPAAGGGRIAATVRDPGRGRERLRQDHHHRQARPPSHGRGPQGGARRRRHVPRRRCGAAAGLGRPQRRAGHRTGRGRGPGRGDLRRTAVRAGSRRGCADRRHRRPDCTRRAT